MDYPQKIRSLIRQIKTRTYIYIGVFGLLISGLAIPVAAPLVANADTVGTIPAVFGNIKFTDYGFKGLASFNVRQSLTTCQVLSGEYKFTLNYGGTNYVHTINVTPTSSGFSGSDSVNGSTVGTVSGSTNGNTFTYTGTYFDHYTYTVSGVINSNESLSVTSWTSSLNQTGGKWTVDGHAYARPCTTNGSIVIKSNSGSLVAKAKISYVETKNGNAWFAGKDNNSKWLFVVAHDGGKPRSGYFGFHQVTSRSIAEQLVLNEQLPISTTKLTVSWGHLIVHPTYNED